MLFYLFSDNTDPLGASVTQKVFRLYDVDGTPWGHVVQSVSKICVPDGKNIVTVSSLLVIDGLGQLPLYYQNSNENEVCGVLSPEGKIVRVRITSDKSSKITSWVGSSLTFPSKCPLKAILPFDPKLTVKQGFYCVLRFYRYTLPPNLVDTVVPIIESQEPMVKPQPMAVQFNYFVWVKGERKKGGPLGFGHDQYATYWNYPDQTVGDFLASRVLVNDISHANYFSLQYGNPTPMPPLPPQSLQYGFDDTDPSITYYIDCWSPKPMVFPSPYFVSVQPPLSSNVTTKEKEEPLKGNVNVYRLDKQTSAYIEGDDYKPGECLATYLFALVTNATSVVPTQCSSFQVLHPYGLLQMRIPVSCFDNDEYYNGCGVNNIDLQYWSVGSHICLDQTDRFLPFWTVNAQMMHDLGQEYGYVVWAPYDDVAALVTDPLSTSPPVITIGKNHDIKAYVLQTPTLAFIFRYRQTRLGWAGNPLNAPCTDTLQEMLATGAITDQLTGEDGVNWCPQLLADDTATSWQEFLVFLDTVV